MAESAVVERQKRGLLFALGVVPVAMAVWVLLWQWGFIASVVAFGLAFGVLWLYNFGAGAPAKGKVVWWLLGIIVAGVALSFVSGMVSDAWYAYTNDMGGTQGFFSGEFWDMFWSNFFTADLWSQYTTDLLIAVAFAALGAGGIIKDLFTQRKPASE